MESQTKCEYYNKGCIIYELLRALGDVVERKVFTEKQVIEKTIDKYYKNVAKVTPGLHNELKDKLMVLQQGVGHKIRGFARYYQENFCCGNPTGCRQSIALNEKSRADYGIEDQINDIFANL